jgi:predicted nucleic acid-binding protein
MIVVADTSPLNYLILIRHIDILESLYKSVVIPAAVRDEMLHESTPAIVRAWAGDLPQWTKVSGPAPIGPALPRGLGAGEREAIAYARTHNADLLLIDEKLGRREAQRLGLQVIGTLGILQEAHERGLLDIHEAILRLQGTTFQIAPSLLKSALESV